MKLRIYDTGYYVKDSLSNQESSENRAGYDGSSTVNYIELNVTKIIRNAGGLTDDNANAGNYTTADVNFTGFENATYTLNCFVKKKDPTTITYQYNQITQILRLEKTKGLKVIYPSSVADSKKTVVELLGAYNANNGVFQGSGKPLSAGTPYISGRVEKVSGLTDDSKSDLFTFKITFQCVEEIQD